MKSSDVFGETPAVQGEVVFQTGPPKKAECHSAWVRENKEMHQRFGVNPIVRNLDAEKLRSFLQFRIDFLQEELNEIKSAESAEDVVDGLIDLCVVAIGTLDAFDVHADLAWKRVHAANMSKSVGIKASRPNPFSLPDLIKPEGWQGPDHSDNVGMLAKIFPK